MAQTYGVYDFRALSPATAAALALGLPDESRVKLKLSGQDFGFDRRLMMNIIDWLSLFWWLKTHRKGEEPPLPFEQALKQKQEEAEKRKLMGFDDPDELLEYLGHKRR